MKANFFIAIVIALLSFSCSDDDNNSNSTSLSQEEKDGLLYMLEEEKLARDTYIYMNNLWGLNQFNNIKNSEQSHMDAIVSILEQNDIEYTILPQGEFSYQNLQDLYNQFVINGQVSSESALLIGATIEDLDIVDLEDYINDSTNSVLISTYENLQCGSRNHLRSFVTAIENLGFTYTPQFLTLEEYEAILNSIQEQCN